MYALLGANYYANTQNFLAEYVKMFQNIAKTQIKPLQGAGNPRIRSKMHFSKIKNFHFFRLSGIPAGKATKTEPSSNAWTPHVVCETVCTSIALTIVFIMKYRFNND